jgi:Tfp pilus assembly protein PilV
MSLKRPRRPRGYILMEATIASAIVAVALLGAYQQVGAVDRAALRAVRELQAAVALSSGFQALRAMDMAGLNAGKTGVLENNQNVPGTIPHTVRRTLVTAQPAACAACRAVSVEVIHESPGRKNTYRARTVVRPWP